MPLTSPVVMTCGDADKPWWRASPAIPTCCWKASEAELDLVLRFRIMP